MSSGVHYITFFAIYTIISSPSIDINTIGFKVCQNTNFNKGYFQISSHTSMVKFADSVELLDVLTVFWCLPFQNGFNFHGFHLKMAFANNMSQDRDFPIAFWLLDVEVIFLQYFQAFECILSELLLCFAFEDKVIHIDSTFSLMNHVLEEHLHHAHKCSWQIT